MDKVSVSPGAYLLGALVLMMVPFRWWAGALLAAASHELAHLGMLKLLGGHLNRMQIHPMCVRMEIGELPRGAEALCSLAGPAASLVLAFSFSDFPELCISAAIQGVFNLIPIYPLDGGRFLGCILPCEICKSIEIFTWFLLGGFGLWLAVGFSLGFPTLIPFFLVAIHHHRRNIPCKEPTFAVQ